MGMILEAVLDGDDVARLCAGLGEVAWTSGKRTAGALARKAKDNLQADGGDARTQALERFVADALRRHPMFEIAARPARLSRVMFSRYEPGMAYGAHTDDALMGAGEDKLRTDLAFTVFLADRDTYEGGELVLESALGAQAIKLGAGDAILYTCGAVHSVAPVTRGERVAAVGWIESYVADASRREVLFDLSLCRARLAAAGVAQDEMLRLDKSISSLLRMWAR